MSPATKLMKTVFLAGTTALFGGALAFPALATEIGCAVVLKTPDGFLNIREGPGTQFKVVGKLNRGDFLYVGSEQCWEDRCTDDQRSWTHLVDVLSPEKPRLEKSNPGWILSRFIQWTYCPENYKDQGN